MLCNLLKSFISQTFFNFREVIDILINKNIQNTNFIILNLDWSRSRIDRINSFSNMINRRLIFVTFNESATYIPYKNHPSIDRILKGVTSDVMLSSKFYCISMVY